MLTEDYVSFEIAKLLKEKGFDEHCTHIYNLNNQHLLMADFYGIGSFIHNSYLNKERPELISSPTLQMAINWLRENYSLHIGVLVNYQYMPRKYEVHIMHTEKYEDIVVNPGTNFDSNKEACEAAIKYCLENLI